MKKITDNKKIIQQSKRKMYHLNVHKKSLSFYISRYCDLNHMTG